MNALPSRCALVVVGVLAGTGAARAEGQVKIDRDGEATTVGCDGREVVIKASRARIELHGACGEVDVKGSGNAIRVERATKIEIWGNRNTIDVAATAKIQTAGNENRVGYVRGLATKKPALKTWGKRNVIKRVDALPPATDPPAGTDGDAGGSTGGARTTDRPATDATALREVQPILCQRNDSVTLDAVVIRTAGVAITTQGNCRLVLTNSKIVSTGATAISTAGSSIVTLDGVEAQGKYGAVMNAGSASVTIKRATLRGTLGVEGSSTVRLEGSTVHGGRSVTPSATYVDAGGNRFVKP